MANYTLSLIPKHQTLDSLLMDFNQLLSASNLVPSLQIENQKLDLIEQIVKKIKQDAPPIFIQPIDAEEEDTPFKKNLRWALYYALLVFGVLEDAANSFFFGSALFALIPAITNPVLFIAAVSYACIESTLFYLFDSAELKDAIGIQEPYTKLSPLIQVYSQQVKATTELNQYLAMISSLHIAGEQYDLYLQFSELMNQDLNKKYEIMCKTKETSLKKIIRISVFSFGAISSLAGSYFMAVTIMSLISVPLITSPAGIAIILLTMAIGIVFHYAMDSSSMTRVVNPDYEKYQLLKQEMIHFTQTYSSSLDGLQKLRTRFEKKKMVDGSTQTDDELGTKTTKQLTYSIFSPKPVPRFLIEEEVLELKKVI